MISIKGRLLSSEQQHLLDDIDKPSQALLFSMQLAGRTQTTVGEELGLTKSHWSGIINGTKNLSHDLLLQFCEVVENDVYLQWLAWRFGYRVSERPMSEKERLFHKRERLVQMLHEVEQEILTIDDSTE